MRTRVQHDCDALSLAGIVVPTNMSFMRYRWRVWSCLVREAVAEERGSGDDSNVLAPLAEEEPNVSTSVLSLILTDVEEKTAPPSMQVLDVVVVGEVAFLAIGVRTESSDGWRFEVDEQIAVERSTLRNALTLETVADVVAAERVAAERSDA